MDNLTITNKEEQLLDNHFFTMFEIFPYDYDNDEQVIKYLIKKKISYNDINIKNSLKEIFYVLQKFFRIYSFSLTPSNQRWKFFLDAKMGFEEENDLEAYNRLKNLSILFAKNLFYNEIITKNEEESLFNGDIITLSDDQKYFLL